jgi:hypothetical protein
MACPDALLWRCLLMRRRLAPPPLSTSAAYNFTTSPSTQATPIPSESMLFGRHFGLVHGLSGRDLVEMSADAPAATPPQHQRCLQLRQFTCYPSNAYTAGKHALSPLVGFHFILLAFVFCLHFVFV